MDSGIKCKLAGDTELCGAAEVLEGRDAVQRDLDRPEKWVHMNLIEFSKSKVLYLGHDNLKHYLRWVEHRLRAVLGFRCKLIVLECYS